MTRSADERLAALRREYGRASLHEDDLPVDEPLAVVRAWVDEAVASGGLEPTAMTLATVDPAGVPDARVVLLRGVDDRGLWWFTDRSSVKGRQLADHPVAAVTLFWPELERQIRLRGRVEDLPEDESDAYWVARPPRSQIAAWASQQSTPVEGREQLESRFAAATERFAQVEAIPRPPHWGGQLLRPDSVELWQGRRSRLHDRLRYVRTVDGWRRERLMP